MNAAIGKWSEAKNEEPVPPMPEDFETSSPESLNRLNNWVVWARRMVELSEVALGEAVNSHRVLHTKIADLQFKNDAWEDRVKGMEAAEKLRKVRKFLDPGSTVRFRGNGGKATIEEVRVTRGEVNYIVSWWSPSNELSRALFHEEDLEDDDVLPLPGSGADWMKGHEADVEALRKAMRES